MKGMNEMVRQAQLMQKKISQLQEQLKERTVEASAGGGMVTVVVSGGKELKSITIDKSVVEAQDVEMLQDLVVAAVNEGIKQAEEMAESEMGQITGGMNIPGLF